MKIKRIAWRNFRSLTDGEICANGHDVTISGRNGAGKSSIANILPFVLFGKISAKGFNAQGLTDNAQVPEAEVEFDNGRKFRRVVTADSKNHTYLDGRDVPASKFNNVVFDLTGGAGSIILNPFTFPTMRWQDQRNFLLETFTTPEELPSDNEIRSRGKTVQTELLTTDARLSEVYSQLNGMPDVSRKEIDEKITAAQVELNALEAKRQLAEGQAQLLRRSVADLNGQIQRLVERHRTLMFNRERLLEKYRAVATVCPTCGARIPKERVEQAKSDITVVGRKTRDEAALVAKKIDELTEQLTTLKRELADAEQNTRQSTVDQTENRIKTLRGILERNRYLRTQLDLRDGLNQRINELTDRRSQLQSELSTLHGELSTVAERRQKLIRKKEHDVNSRFEFVSFKLFKILSTTNEFRETCEPMIDGVPFANLSKGEKFKAACDILRTFQTSFKCEMPLMIDDAESYTPNSLIELPNQKFLFTVTDCDLKIKVHDD